MKQLIKIFPLLATLLFAVNITADAGSYLVEDFERHPIGTKFKIVNRSSGQDVTSSTTYAEVALDPTNANNKVLHVFMKAWNNAVEINLIDDLAGHKLTDLFQTLKFRFRRVTSKNYLQFHAFIGNESLYSDSQYLDQGNQNTWLDKSYQLNAASNNNTSTSFRFGLHSDESEYYIDDVIFEGTGSLEVAPTFTKNLEASYNVIQGKHLALEVAATGNPDIITYQWYYDNDTKIDGATSTSYTVPTAETGSTTYYCSAKNSKGTTKSTVTTVTVSAPEWTNIKESGLKYIVNGNNELIVQCIEEDSKRPIPDYNVTRTIILEDFENKKVEDNWTISGINPSDHGTAQIQANPTDANNKALKYTTAAHKADEWLQFDFQLSNGTITENQTLEFDLYIANCNNYDPMKYKFSGSETNLINRVADQQKDVWKTYSVNVPTGNNSFTLYIGGMNFDKGCVFYIDNFRLTGGKEICDHPWADDKSTVTKVTVREGVTRIGNNAFNGFDNITEVDIPSTVETIGSNAFTNKPTINFHSNPNTNTFGGTRNLILFDSDKPYMSNNQNEYNSIHYYRTTTANYFTLVVPFDAEIPSGMKVYEMAGVSVNNPNAISFQIVTGGHFVKNTPYLVWMENPTDFELTATPSSLTITPNVENNEKGAWTMTGAYDQKTIDATATNCYAFSTSDNKLHKYTKLNVAPFRCYFTSTTSSARMAVNFEDDFATDIDECNNTEAVPTEVYNINGIRQNGMQKGLNIVRFSNGVVKSVIIK